MSGAGGDANIIGGEPIASAVVPAVVALVDGDGLCTGALVSARHVLTAGHCTDAFALTDPTFAALVVHVGTNNPSDDPGIEVGVIAVHRYEPSDLAVVELVPTAALDDISVLVPTVVDRFGDGLATAGFGVYDLDPSSAGVLHALSDLQQATCPAGSVDKVCFADASRGVCFGDSGAPLWSAAQPDALLGVISTVTNPGCTGTATATRITADAAEFLRSHDIVVSDTRGGSCAASAPTVAAWLPLFIAMLVAMPRRRMAR
ncbi:MAG: trypsin-like serine protease [Myxococcales bacterium]|nr:trypsin-like serine protease [Myxococcales bacterium]